MGISQHHAYHVVKAKQIKQIPHIVNIIMPKVQEKKHTISSDPVWLLTDTDRDYHLHFIGQQTGSEKGNNLFKEN